MLLQAKRCGEKYRNKCNWPCFRAKSEQKRLSKTDVKKLPLNLCWIMIKTIEADFLKEKWLWWRNYYFKNFCQFSSFQELTRLLIKTLLRFWKTNFWTFIHNIKLTHFYNRNFILVSLTVMSLLEEVWTSINFFSRQYRKSLFWAGKSKIFI